VELFNVPTSAYYTNKFVDEDQQLLRYITLHSYIVDVPVTEKYSYGTLACH